MLPDITFAEQKALEAVQLESFPLQLSDIRRTVHTALEQFGRNNIFAEYTVHTYAHVHSMLLDAERLIPGSVQLRMSKADWLMLVLCIYFHDLGLIVTNEEFNNRDRSTFEAFKNNVLFAGRDGDDYKQKVNVLGSDLAERFFYQEFVRRNHGQRVATWIGGAASAELGYAKSIIEEIDRLFGSVTRDFRRDLALVCESHTLDDIGDPRKYKIFRPYGPSSDEVCNLLYTSVMLRTIDLLQITKQRAPSIMFRLINPTDPISQVEWVKQNSVTGVFIAEVRDAEGHLIPNVLPDTIAVFAKFTDENGFFGLSSYLQYAQRQLTLSYDAVKKAHPGNDEKYVFPWKRIDDREVEADGFDPRPYQFQLDQTKILDLLTGHTLYNDSSVAVRELVQNSIDAVRLQYLACRTSFSPEGKVNVDWDSSTQILTIRDNGTGMTQDTIEKHLLSVGSSKYQEPAFKEKYPDFNSISRYGIGVLSSFMVADNIQIITFTENEDEGRQISLRSVHGRYLIRLLKKTSDEYREIGPHGTKITIKIRSSSKKVDVKGALDRWIVFPRCLVSYTERLAHPISIGFPTAKAALEAFIKMIPELQAQEDVLNIVEQKSDGLEVAVVQRYSKHFRERSIHTFRQEGASRHSVIPTTGICVEGIRVDFDPGGTGILSIANYTGTLAPRTNVSRSALESETVKNQTNSKLFSIYLSIVQNEIERLQTVEQFSLSYATNQFSFIAGALQPRSAIGADKKLFDDFPLLIVEDESGRSAESITRLRQLGKFWTVESKSIDSLMDILQDAKSDLTARGVAQRCEFKGEQMPSGPMVTNIQKNSLAKALVEAEFEIRGMKASILDRRLDVNWQLKVGKGIWSNLTYAVGREFYQISEELRAGRRNRMYHDYSLSHFGSSVPTTSIECQGLESYFAASVLGTVHLLPGTSISDFFNAIRGETELDSIRSLLYSEALSPALSARIYSGEAIYRSIDFQLREINARYGEKYDLDIDALLTAVKESGNRLLAFMPYSWSRGDTPLMEEIYF